MVELRVRLLAWARRVVETPHRLAIADKVSPERTM
jgi:hypothetical protein